MTRDITDEVKISSTDFSAAKRQGQVAEKARVHSFHWVDTAVQWVFFIPMMIIHTIGSIFEFVIVKSGLAIGSVILWTWAVWLCSNFYHTLLFAIPLPLISEWSLSFSITTWVQIVSAFCVAILIEVTQSKGWKELRWTLKAGHKPEGYWYFWEMVWFFLTAMETAIFLHLSQSKGFSQLALIELVVALFGAKAAEEFAKAAKKGEK